MQDAVTLANCLYDMKGLSPLDINEAFDMYKDERYPKVKNQFSASKTNAKLIYGHVKALIIIFVPWRGQVDIGLW